MDFSNPYNDPDADPGDSEDRRGSLDPRDFEDPGEEETVHDPGESRERRSRQRRDSRSRDRRGSGGGGSRQQLLLRRGLALGLGILILLLLVLGAKGCLDARKNRSLENYASSVSQIVTETNTLGKSFTGRLSDPGDLSVTEFTSEIESDRGAMEGFLSRVEKLSTPGDMTSAQDSLTLVYQLRAGALNTIADRMSTALGDEGREKAVRQIASQMEVLAAADVLYNRVTRHQVDDTIAAAGANAAELPVSTFIDDPAKWIDATEVQSALSGVSGGPREATDGGVHGTGIASVSIGGTTLDPSVSSTIPAGTDPTVDVAVQNQGESDESGIKVSVTVDGTPLDGTIPDLAVGETGTASIPLTPAPTGEVQLDVKVEGVPGEQVLDNNEASYTVNFG